MMKETIKKELEQAQQVLANFISKDTSLQAIQRVAELMIISLRQGGKIISCGNGGSMADAIHFAEELTGRLRENRPPIAAIAISDPGHITCVANDYGYDHIFSRYVEAVGHNGDVLLAISTSGNSKNVIEAAKVARQKGLKVVVLSGKQGGELAHHCDVEVRVSHDGYADRIQEVHIKIIHVLCKLIEEGLR